MQMARCIYNVSLRDRKSSKRLRNRQGIANIRDAMNQARLKWFGHVQRMNIENPVSNCRLIEVNVQRRIGRPHKTINADLRELRLQPGLTQK